MKKKRLAYGLKLLLLIAVLAVVTYMVYAYQISRKQTRVGYKYSEATEISGYTPVLSSTEDVVSQQFEAQYSILNKVKIPVIFGDNEEEETGLTEEQIEAEPALILTILDENGQSVWSGEEDLSEVTSGSSVTFDMELSLKAGAVYTCRIAVTASDLSAETLPQVRLLLSEQNAEQDDRIASASYNGETLDGLLVCSSTYTYVNSLGHFWLVLIADACILLFFLFGERTVSAVYVKWPVLKRIGGALIWILTPPVVWYLTQRICRWSFTPDFSYQKWTLLFYYLILTLLTCVCRKIRTGGLLFTLLLTLLAVADYFVMLFRSKPLMVTDFTAVGTAASVVSSYKFTIELRTGLFMLACLLWLLIISIGIQGRFSKAKRTRVVRLGGVVLAAAGLIWVDQYKLQDSWLSRSSFWSLNATYGSQGYLTTLLAEVHYIKVEMPENYSVETAQVIVEAGAASYEEAKGEENAADDTKETTEAITPENIIIIMNESFWDPWTLGDVEVEEDFIPYWHSLLEQDNVSTGLLYMPVSGGGTSNSEYEVLTGNACHFLSNDLMAYETNCADPEHGLAEILETQGYRSVAIHPNNPAAWNRERVYEWMGFDEFINLYNWDVELEKIRGYVSDANVYQEIEYLTENKAEGEKLFTFCVTIQNHGGYAVEDFPAAVSLEYTDQYELGEQFFTLMNESDQALEQLITYYENVDEPTMIVFFGDHQPAVEMELRQAVRNSDGNTDPDDPDWLYRDSYVIWTNYDVEEVKDYTMSANYLGAYALQMAGLELTDYQKLALETMQEVPIIGVTGYRDAEGNWYTYSDETSLENMSDLENLLNDYSIVQYNNAVDRSNTLTQYFTVEEQ